MATINPHTTRATGTVLTAVIYNTDHENHISNAGSLNTEVLALTAKFPGTTLDNELPRFNGVSGDLQASGVLLDDNNRMWIRHVDDAGTSTFDDAKDRGVLFTAHAMSTTAKYTPGVMFGSSDANLVTENPKILAGIFGKATETYAADTDGGMAITFFVSPDNGGANADPVVSMELDYTDIDFYTNDTYRAGINNVGTFSVNKIGGTGLTNTGATIDQGGVIICSTDDESVIRLCRTGSVGTVIGFYQTDGDFLAGISHDNTTVVYATSSDPRLKNSFRDFDSGAMIDALKMYEFNWNTGGIGYGPNAMELHKVFPIAVTVGKGEPGEEGFEPWGWDASKLVPLLVREIQELRRRMEILEWSVNR